MANFTHLHVHTEYSLLDGLSNIKLLTKKAKQYNMESVAISDHGVMYGAIEFYKACLKEGIKPIIGMEAYVSKEDHTAKDPKKKSNSNHLLLLAKNLEGYQNLMRLTSIAHLDGYYYRPRFDKDTLQKYSAGLICTSACPAGELAEALINDNLDKGLEVARWYQDIFKNNYYLELQRHEYERYLPGITDPAIRESVQKIAAYEKLINEGVVKISRELSIPLIATNDVHYIDPEDAPAQDALVCVATGKTVPEVNRLRYIDTPTFYFRSPEDMQMLFPEYPEALTNTVEIAKKCDLQITLGKWFFPKSPDVPADITEEDYLKQQAWQLLPDKVTNITDEVKSRLEYELETICTKGYAGYFLIMQALTNWTTEQGLTINTRGSAAGSLVSFVLGISTVNPLTYNLPFERLLNPYRPSPPDIDLDIADNRRQDLIQYITQKFGQEKVAQICTFGRMLARGSVRDIARVLNYPYQVGDSISKLIPLGSQGFPMSIDRALKESSELKYKYDNDPDAKLILDLSKKVEGSARHVSVHAAGVVVAPTNITDFSPLQREAKGDKIITQYEFHACEEIGLIKFDVLGITNLTILDAAIKIIEKTTSQRVDLSKIPQDDPKTFEMLSKGDTIGVFQMGGSGLTKWLRELKPNRVEDLMIMVALYRPGPMANIPEFIARKNGLSPVKYLHPKMAKFLDKTYGILVYQEDILFTALELAGYTWATVDALRKAIGKKLPKEMAEQHEVFVKGCIEHSGMNEKEAEKIWDLFVPFQGYGFNKAHAASYGMVSYYTAYLKANYTVEYMTAMLTADAGDTDKITAGIEECRKMGIVILSPDINLSHVDFTIEPNEKSLDNKSVRFGLSAIKNVGVAAIEAILEARAAGPFQSLSDFLQRIDGRRINKKVLESLIKTGALDAFGNRAALLAAIDDFRTKADASKKRQSSGQVDMFGESDKKKSSPDSPDSILKDSLPEIADFSPSQKLAFEKELLGFYLTDNPIQRKLLSVRAAISHHISDLKSPEMQNQQVQVGGVITASRVVITKKNQQQMAFVTITDATGSIEAVIFPQLFAQTKNCWKNDQVVLCYGKVELREDELSLIVDKVIPATVEAMADPSTASESQPLARDDIERHSVIIPRRLDRNKLISLNSLLKDHPGEDLLTLIFENGATGGKPVNIPFGIDYSKQLQTEIVTLLQG